jgi:hypothetical protein
VAEAALVDRDIDFGREVVRALDQEPPMSGLRPLAALWLYRDDEDLWRLVLVLPALENESPQEVYRHLIDVVDRRVSRPDVPMDVIRLAPPDYPLRRTLRSALRTEPEDLSGLRFKHNVVNGELIDDAFIYRLT